MIQSALHFPDLEKCFTYAERMRVTHEKFFTVVESQGLCQNPHKMTEYSETWQSFRDKMCGFLAKTLTSAARRKFFMRRTHTF